MAFLFHKIQSLYEGKTVSYIWEDPNDDYKLYNKEDVHFIPINNPVLIKSFVPFSRDSDGGIIHYFMDQIIKKVL